MTERILICEPCPEGIFSAVYTAYEKKLEPEITHIQLGRVENYRLFTEYMEVETDVRKAHKVERSLRKKLGAFTAESLWYALSSVHPDRGDAVYHTIVRGLSGAFRGELMDYLQDPYVNLVSKLRIRVWHEIHQFMGFLRFAQLESGILYSEIQPENYILPFLGEHFADRFPNEDFLIRDKGRNLYLVHQVGEEYFLFKGQKNTSLPEYAKEEEEIQQLFRCFIQAVSIKERENRRLQQQMLPLRFRKNMVDFD